MRDVCQGLADRGHSVHTFTSDLDQHALRSYLMETPHEAKIRGVQVTRLCASYLPFISAYPWIRRLPARLFAVPATLLHGHSFYYSAADVAAQVARRKRVPFVFNPYYYPPRGMARRLYHRTVGRLTMAADVVITISQWERSLIEKVGFRVKRFESVPPGVDTAVFDVARPNVYGRFGIDVHNARILLFVGRLAPEKGVDTLIHALPSVLKSEPEVVLAIVGPC